MDFSQGRNLEQKTSDGRKCYNNSFLKMTHYWPAKSIITQKDQHNFII